MNIVIPHRRKAFTAASSWTPDDMGTQRFWADATQLGLSNNDPISTFTDAYGLHNFTQSTSTAKPTYKTSIQNGQPAAYFDGGDYVTMANTTDLNDVTGDYTFWAVYKYDSVAPALSTVFFKGDGATQAGTVFEFLNWNGYQAQYWQHVVTGTSNIILNYSTATEDTSWHYAIVTRNGSSYSFREDAATIETGTLAGTGNTAAQTPALGAFGSGSWKMTGYIGECGMVAEYDSSYTSNLETYLSDKWGL